MKKIRQLILTLAVLVGALVPLSPVLVGSTVYACTDSKSCAQEGVCAANSSGCTTNPDGSVTATDGNSSVSSLISTVINILSLIVGATAVIMIIIGGFKYITSSGDSANVSSAKNTILYAIVGLVIVALAQVIVRFVISKTT